MSTLEHSARRIAAVSAAVLFVPAAPAAAATVVRVIDGDTVKVREDGKVRTVDLAGVNAPEPGACAGPEARRGLGRLLPAGAHVRLQRDTDAPARARYVLRGDRLVNAAVLRQGLARPEDTGELSKRAALEAAAQEAQQQRKGIWKSCEAVPTPSPTPAPSPAPPTGGPEAIQRARTDLADRMFIKITSTSILNSSEARLHLCRDGYSALDISWSNDASGGSGTSRTEGSWEVVSAEYTATTATARVRLFNGDGETFRTFFAQGQRVSIDGVDQTQVASSDLCAVRTGG
ncbi:thermonuclease family protein [Solirubrobacter ginsenosidimutans]|uniref:Thermonuclease family protein n=1 Tax=Solirubrobacter ginsenosidimutans TaxID=490573 RepID=A0A9X3MNQ3_9ACTN|nr:thermonuclease family protein [Solirubrobacter ginsenosidimutans]MDA0159829.1 thermonuclease family protein [Solirubrobacter ginsenosidimutans]